MTAESGFPAICSGANGVGLAGEATGVAAVDPTEDMEDMGVFLG